MSGLTVFFQHFLPKDSNAFPNNYEQSTASLLLTSSSSSSFAREDRPQDNPSNNEGPHGQLQQQQQEGRNASTTTDAVRWTEPLTYKDWKRQEKQVLNTFLQHRILHVKPRMDDNINSNDGEQEDGDDNHKGRENDRTRTEGTILPPEDTSQEWETQQQFETQGFTDLGDGMGQQQQQCSGSSDDVNDGIQDEALLPSQPPHIHKAIHTVHYLTDLDLHTREAHFQLLVAHRWCKLRPTHRPGTRHAIPRRQPMIEVYQGPVKVPLRPCVDDGPLSCIYKYVWSGQVYQANQPSSHLRQRATAVMQQDTSIRRLQLFLYNGYAQAMEKVTRQMTDTQSLVLSLQHIPASCIFPIPMTSWVDYDLSQYCVCIGDDSQVQYEDEDGNVTLMRFNASSYQQQQQQQEVVFRVAIVQWNTKTVVKEWTLVVSENESEVVLKEAPVSVIGPALRAEPQQHTFVPAASEVVTTTAHAAGSATPTEFSRTQEIGTGQIRTTTATHPDGMTNPESSTTTSDSDIIESSLHGTLSRRDPTKALGHDSTMTGTTPIATENDLHTSTRERNAQAQVAETEKDPTSVNSNMPMEEERQQAAQSAELYSKKRANEMMEKDNSQSTGKDHSSHDSIRDGTTAQNDGSDVENDRTQTAAKTATEMEPSVPLSTVHDNRDPKNSAITGLPFRIIQDVKQPKSPLRGKEKQTLRYLRLGELRAQLDSHKAISQQERSVTPCIVHLYAVVLGFSCPTRTSRGDWMVTAALVDESLPLDSDGDTNDSISTVNINIFSKDKSSLPKLHFAGDVLRLHRVKLQEWKDEIQLMGLKASSYVVCRKEATADGDDFEWNLIPTSRSQFEISEGHKKKFASLWDWGQKRMRNFPTMKASVAFQLSDITRHDSESSSIDLYETENSRGDLTVMVTGIIPCINSGMSFGPCAFLRVWDGTGLARCDPLVNLNPHVLESLSDGDPPVKAVVKIANLAKTLQSSRPDDKPLLTPYALTGRVVNVAVWEQSQWELVQEVVEIGTFIRLRNVKYEKIVDEDIRCLMVHSKSSMTPLPELTFEVVKIIEQHNERLERKDEVIPSSGLLPLQEDEEALTLDDSEIETASSKARHNSPSRRPPKRRKESHSLSADFSTLFNTNLPVKFSGVVNIVGTIPSFPDLASGGIENIMNARHSFAVKLEDSDLNQIDAIVQGGSDAVWTILGKHSVSSEIGVEFATSFLRSVIKNRWKWAVEIRSVIYEGAKYFVLDDIEKSEDETK